MKGHISIILQVPRGKLIGRAILKLTGQNQVPSQCSETKLGLRDFNIAIHTAIATTVVVVVNGGGVT